MVRHFIRGSDPLNPPADTALAVGQDSLHTGLLYMLASLGLALDGSKVKGDELPRDGPLSNFFF